MSYAVTYSFNNEEMKTYFTNPKGCLPVLRKNRSIALVTWGRHKLEAGNLPLGGWARSETVKSGRWDKYFPKPVKLPLTSFMEKDIEGRSVWFTLTPGQWVQGLLARYDDELRVYIVTMTPEREDALFERWPKMRVD